jgi:hypothetical protein
MGYLFHYKGSGPGNLPYKNSVPQGHFADDELSALDDRDRPSPRWAVDSAKRRNVILVYLERRANQSHRVPEKDFKQRMRAVCDKLGPTAQQAIDVLHDYFPEGSAPPYRSWDAGQCAHRHGIDKQKIKHMIRTVRKIAHELYPNDSERPRAVRKMNRSRIGVLKVRRRREN